MIDHDNELLTIAEATRLLKVGRTTLHRWLRTGRLRAYHVGPRAVRIRRGDLAEIMTLSYGNGTVNVKETEAASLQAAIRPLTDEEVERGLAALAAAEELISRQRAMRGGQPYDESWPLIRAAREERSKQLQ
jgi:excisionase family DNA binding protein